MSVFSGDFLGFQLGDIHSSTLKITRVSSSGWYSDTITPNFSDLVANVPGVNETYYWDTNFTQKPITLNFAFDDVSDGELRRIQQVFNFKGVQKLVFDETSYKYYMVKCSAPPTIRYICFDQDEYRIYKGEGEARLVAYFPYGIASYNSNVTYNKNGSIIANQGDLPCDSTIIYDIKKLKKQELLIKISDKYEKVLGQLQLRKVKPLSDTDKYVRFDFNTHLIEGLDENKEKTGNLYNRYIEKGDFFKIPQGASTVFSSIEFDSWYFTPLYY